MVGPFSHSKRQVFILKFALPPPGPQLLKLAPLPAAAAAAVGGRAVRIVKDSAVIGEIAADPARAYNRTSLPFRPESAFATRAPRRHHTAQPASTL